MIIHDIEQYSDEWWSLRQGRFTASQAAKLLTPTGKLSTQFRGELGRMVAEQLGLQEPEKNEFSTEWMDRGSDLENEARAWLAVVLDMPIRKVGMVTDGEIIAASPDALIEQTHTAPDGYTSEYVPVEIKVPKPSTHIQWLLDGGLPKEHKAQVHFQMVVTQSPYAYFMSYHPELEPLIVRVEADDYTDAMAHAIEELKNEYMKAFTAIKGGRSV
jgi:hypothetical protein